MSLRKRREFAKELLKKKGDEILKKLALAPKKWTGMEITWFIADNMENLSGWRHRGKPRIGIRYMEYLNECCMRNLT